MKCKLLFLFILCLPLLAACSPIQKMEQPQVGNLLTLDSSSSLGQTFTARYDGLMGVVLYLSPDQAGDSLELHLRHNPEETTDLATSILPLDQVTEQGHYYLSFDPQAASHLTDYFILLKIAGRGSIKVGYAVGSTYYSGAMYQGKQSRDDQLTFHLVYDRRLAYRGLANEGLGWLGRLVIGGFLFILPGWALFSLFWLSWEKRHWAEKLALASGLSLAIYPLLILWTNLIGLRLGAAYAWGPALIAFLALIWSNRGRIARLPSQLHSIDLHPGQFLRASLKPELWTELILIGVLGLLVVSRFWGVRTLDVPLGSDSLHHTMIVQLLLDHNGLFDSWQPYAELTTMNYHYGFHSAAAVYHWITGAPVEQAVLWAGQILNILSILALYPLARKVGGGAWAGLAAIVLAGLLFDLPMVYTNWGRYTQLAGQVILPTAVYLLWEMLEADRLDRRPLILAWMLLSGLALTHYRVLLMGLLFIPTLWLWGAAQRSLKAMVVRIFWLGLGSGILFLPWLVRSSQGMILDIFFGMLSTPASAVPKIQQTLESSSTLLNYLPGWAWLLLPVALVIGLWRRNRGLGLICTWWFIVLAAANPGWFNLPGQGVVSSSTVMIAMYLPAAWVLADLMSWIAGGLVKIVKRPALSIVLTLALLCTTLGLSAWGARARLFDLRLDQSMYAAHPDVKAAEWIRLNTPQEAIFLVNGGFPFGPDWCLGADGGWWLPLLARRVATLPPMVYTMESGPRPDYYEWVNELPHEIQAKGLTHPDVLALMRDRGVTYYYVGQRYGDPVLYNAPFVPIPDLLNNPHYHLVYHQDRVWIFEISY